MFGGPPNEASGTPLGVAGVCSGRLPAGSKGNLLVSLGSAQGAPRETSRNNDITGCQRRSMRSCLESGRWGFPTKLREHPTRSRVAGVCSRSPPQRNLEDNHWVSLGSSPGSPQDTKQNHQVALGFPQGVPCEPQRRNMSFGWGLFRELPNAYLKYPLGCAGVCSASAPASHS